MEGAAVTTARHDAAAGNDTVTRVGTTAAGVGAATAGGAGATTGVGTTAKTPSKTQLAHDYLRSHIIDYTFTPGYRLVLSQIARDLDISVVPVREAIRMLEAEGLVTYVHNVGAQVAFPDPNLYQTTMETLSVVEGYATGLSAPKLTSAELDEAANINTQLRTLADTTPLNPNAFTVANRRFHEVLTAHCSNAHIADLVRRGWARLETLRDSSFALVPERANESVDEHEHLLDLIRDGAPALDIELAAREHRQRTMRSVMNVHVDIIPTNLNFSIALHPHPQEAS